MLIRVASDVLVFLACLCSVQNAFMLVHDHTDPAGLVERVQTPDEYCEAWPLLRTAAWLKVNVDNGVVTPRVLHCVGQASHITRLQLHCHSGTTATHHDLAAALAPLKLLKWLDVDWFKPIYWQLAPDIFGSTAAMKGCARAIAGMTGLTRLALRHVPLRRWVADDVTSLQQLTSLGLSCCELDDYTVSVITLRLRYGGDWVWVTRC